MKRFKMLFVFLSVVMVSCMVFFSMEYNNRNAGNVENDEVIVAVIDSGVDVDAIPEERITDFKYDCIKQVKEVTDEYGHGTSVASLIVANTNDRVKIMPIRITDDEGNSTIDLVYEGITYAVDNGADVINLSMNTYFYSEDTKLEELIDSLVQQGIPVIVSAGNNGEDVKYITPANMESSIVVGAVDDSGERYFFSNYGDTVDYYAYGKYDGQLGTSFASAYVTARLAEQMQVSGCGFEEALEQIPMELKAENCILAEKVHTGTKTNEEGTLYIGNTEKTSHDIGVGILDIDWRNLDTEELDAYIGETDYSYVGLFISKLSEEDRQALIEKSSILSTDVYVGHMEYSKEEDAYLEASSEEIPYVEYALQCYEKEKDVLSVSDWICRNNATFYISSPDRQKIGKYTISGFNGKYAHLDDDREPISSFSYALTAYKNKSLSYTGDFTMPSISSVSRYIRNARATLVEYYDSSGKLVKETFKPGHVAAGNDDGALLLGISIKFKGYVNERTGYHNTEDAVVAYNAGAGVGTTTKTATYTDVGTGKTTNQIYETNFNYLALADKMVVTYDVTLNPGADINNFTKSDIAGGQSKTLKNIYYLSDETSLTDNSTFYLNGNPYYSLGLKWYSDDDNELVAYSDIPEYVMKLAPNTYTVKYNGNGSTSGSTASSSHTYDTAKTLTANGFKKTGYTFTGWNTKADGSGTSYANKASVKNLTATNGGTVTLYAQWRPNVATVRFHVNGGSLSSDSTYSVKSSLIYNSSGVIATQKFNYEATSVNFTNYETFGLVRTGYHITGTSAWKVNNSSSLIVTQGAISDAATLNSLKDLIKNGDATITMYANWQANTLTMYFNTNGGTITSDTYEEKSGVIYKGSDKATQSWTYNNKKTNGLVNASTYGLKKEGYTFKGWKVGSSGTTVFDQNDGTLVPTDFTSNIKTGNCSVTMYAVWEPNTATVRFHVNGGKVESDTYTTTSSIVYKAGKVATQSFNYEATSVNFANYENLGLVRTGYHIIGTSAWKVNNSSSLIITQGTISDTDTLNKLKALIKDGNDTITMYANWQPNTYTIKFDGNGATGGSMSNMSCTYNKSYTLPDNKFSKTGYSFEGWNTKANGTGKSYEDGDTVKNLTTENNGVVTLYAQWGTADSSFKINHYTENVDGSYSLNSTVKKAGNTGMLIKTSSYKKEIEGFTYNHAKVNGVEATEATVLGDGSLVVDLYYKRNTYIVRFEGNGATGGSMSDFICAYGVPSQLPENGFTKTHYTFSGWNTEADGSGAAYESGSMIENLTEIPNEVITLYAQWTANKYYIHFDANEGEGYMDDITLTYDTPQRLPSNVFTRNNGYGDSVFLGWGLTPDTREVLYVDGAEVLNATEIDFSTLTLYAIWDDCPWIEASDQYYSLEDAKNGVITYDELISHALASDREDGDNIPAGVNPETGTSFTIIDYQPSDFTIFTAEGSVTETFQVVDSIGNIYKQMITVYIVDTEPKEIKPVGTTRFINEKYYYESFENGGLEDNSIWKTDPEYISVITEAFENSRNNTPIMSFYFEYEDILEMKQFVHENGIGNTVHEDALERFYEQFMVPNTVN